ncbi:MAG: fructose 1,6-bisphosphatase [Chloroflexi bacterium]|nr:fructose 1,6-bisphosphatase [Chloroflexota bacterium]
MRLTLSILKADVGSIGGHTKPSQKMIDATKQAVSEAIAKGLLIDAYVSHTGDDIAILSTHTRGPNNTEVHQFAWDTFLKATAIAQKYGLYGAGQDLLVDAPSGNLRGAGPAVAELEFEHNPVKTNKVRPAESFMMLAADKCGPGAYNLPIFLGFADPMYCAGLMLPKLIKGFTFNIIDMDNTEGDSDGEPAVSVSAMRLHNIAGTYTGKDDPVALMRNQGIFPAPEELVSAFTKAHYVGGDARGSHVMPLMPVPINTAVSGIYCLPLVSCTGFSVDASGHFSENVNDFFDNPAWDYVRTKAQEKALYMREQGWSGAAMLPYHELEYSGFRDTVEGLMKQFAIRDGHKKAAAPVAARR